MARRRQPVREIPAAETGDLGRQGHADLQRQLPAAQVVEPPAAAVPSRLPYPEGIFGPTDRPNEPVTAGIPMGPGPPGQALLPDDPDELLRVLIEASGGHPALVAMMARTRMA